MELSDEQNEALDKIKEFLKDNLTTFSLIGSAGTGKSYTLSYLIDYLEKSNIQYCLAAPTHKAALVMQRYTKRDAITIHSLLKLSPNLDILELDFKNLLFFSGNNLTDIPSNGLVIIDEASMISDDLYDLLLEKVSKFKSKILWILDSRQLQPVKSNKVSKVVENKNKFILSKIWRQDEENAILSTLSELREVSKNKFDTSIGNSGSLVVTSKLQQFLEVAKSKFKEAIFEKDVLKVKLLCYTNARINAYNKVMHKLLFGEDEFYNGEFLLGNDNLTFNNFKFYNSMDYIIVDEPEEILIKIPHFKIPLLAWRLTLYDSLTKESEKIVILSKNISKNDLDLLSSTIENFRMKAVELKKVNRQKSSLYWRYYYEMINSFTTSFDLYFDNRLIRKKSFDYGYAQSVHKSQGSTYNNVLVDMKDIQSCRDENVRRQLQYVALSRTSKSVLLLQ